MIEYMNTSGRRAGFTLLEIIVVVSIIGILSAVSYSGLSGSRDLAADKAMMAEFKQVQTALELYRTQNDDKRYPLPNTAGACGSGGAFITSSDNACATDYIVGLTPSFISELPSSADSSNSPCDIEYTTTAGGSWYKLTAINCIGGDEDITVDHELSRCPTSCATGCGGTPMNSAYLTSDAFTKSFAIYSIGGECR